MRRHGIDWLRILAVFLLFPFHAARVFDQWEANYIKDVPSALASWFVAGTGFWFMPLLFLIAGFSAYHALGKRTVREYTRERLIRLLVPLLFGLVLVVPVQGYVASLRHEGFTGSYLHFLGGYFTDFHDISGYTGGFTPAHLWFILYLFIISMALLPLLLKLRAQREKRVISPALLLLAFVPLVAAEALPDIGGKNPFFYALLFLYGFLMARSGSMMETVRRMRFAALTAALLLSPVYLALASRLGWPDGVTLTAAGIALLRNLCVWLAVLALTGLADAYLDRPGPALSYLNRASYPVYILHQSVMMVIAYYVTASLLPPAVKFLVIMLGALAASLILYELCRRIAPARLILGIKAEKHDPKLEVSKGKR